MSALEMLARWSESSEPPTPEGLLTDLVRRGCAERGFLLWNEEVWAVDVDGFALGHGKDRLRRDWLAAAGGVARREEPSSVLTTTLQTGVGAISVLLEHRFRPRAFREVDEDEFLQWVLTTAVGLRWAQASALVLGGLTEVNDRLPAGKPSQLSGGLSGSEEEVSSLSALEQNNWNISRAARCLGMTRHGLKKRMSRLGIERPSAPS